MQKHLWQTLGNMVLYRGAKGLAAMNVGNRRFEIENCVGHGEVPMIKLKDYTIMIAIRVVWGAFFISIIWLCAGIINIVL